MLWSQFWADYSIFLYHDLSVTVVDVLFCTWHCLKISAHHTPNLLKSVIQKYRRNWGEMSCWSCDLLCTDLCCLWIMYCWCGLRAHNGWWNCYCGQNWNNFPWWPSTSKGMYYITREFIFCCTNPSSLNVIFFGQKHLFTAKENVTKKDYCM